MKVKKDTKDEEIVDYTRKTDKEYYSYIIDRYEVRLKRYLNRMTNYSSEVDDLVQQTLVNAYINLNDFNIDKKFSSWIYRIAHNLTVNWFKKKKANIFIEEDLLANKLKAEIDIHKSISDQEDINNLKKAINKLPDKFKQPIILKYMEDLSYNEISDILRKPKNTIGTMINRAKKILKKELEKYD